MKLDSTVWTAVLILLVGFAVYRLSPRGQLYDSRYTLVVASRLALAGSPALDELGPELVEDTSTTREAAERDYRLVLLDGHLHYLYPAGTPLLAVPWVLGMHWLDQSVVDDEGRYHRDIERRGQRMLAALWMAALAAAVFVSARMLLSIGPSLAITLAIALGSPIWSSASRSLWTHTATVLLHALAVLVLLRGMRDARRTSPILLASLLAWGVFCRPTAAIPALGVALWVAVRRRDQLPALLATGAVWAVLGIAFSRWAYESVLPPYYSLGLHRFEAMPTALLGNLVSPARGLLIYSPWIVGVAWGAWRMRKKLPDPWLAGVAAAIGVVHWLLVSSHAPWWAGWGYGPRLMTDAIPWIALLAILVVAAAPPPDRLGGGARSLLAAAVCASVLLHGIGAFSRGAVEWNRGQERPHFEDRLWDWRDPPFLRRSAR